MTTLNLSYDDVESAFYTAFNHCDVEAMKKLWADEDVVCVHPGQRALTNYDSIIRSWSHIFSNAEMLNIHFNVIKRIQTEDLVIHIVEEVISSSNGLPATVVPVTNIYRQYNEGWLMIGHHASMIHSQSAERTLQ